jgi:hypothetical protein
MREPRPAMTMEIGEHTYRGERGVSAQKRGEVGNRVGCCVQSCVMLWGMQTAIPSMTHTPDIVLSAKKTCP